MWKYKNRDEDKCKKTCHFLGVFFTFDRERRRVFGESSLEVEIGHKAN